MPFSAIAGQPLRLTPQGSDNSQLAPKSRDLVEEVALGSEIHCYSSVGCRRNNFVVANGTAWLDNCLYPGTKQKL
jgi:hypothetical protein